MTTPTSDEATRTAKAGKRTGCAGSRPGSAPAACTGAMAPGGVVAGAEHWGLELAQWAQRADHPGLGLVAAFGGLGITRLGGLIRSAGQGPGSTSGTGAESTTAPAPGGTGTAARLVPQLHSAFARLAVEAHDRGVTAAELEAERRDVELRAFGASLTGLDAQEIEAVMRGLETAPDTLADQKLDIARRAARLQSIAVGDVPARLTELEQSVADLRGRQDRAREEKNDLVLQTRALFSSSAQRTREERRRLMDDLAALEKAHTEELELIRRNIKEIDMLRALFLCVVGPDASGLQKMGNGYLEGLPAFLGTRIDEARGRYDVSRIDALLARVEREPLARETLAAIRARGPERLYASRDVFQQILARKEWTLHSLEPGRLERLLGRWGSRTEDPERDAVRRGLAGEIEQVRADLAKAAQRIAVFESEEYRGRVAREMRAHETISTAHVRLDHIQRTARAMR
ncbi:hypothetical protein ABT071_38090 [Streptomyces sp. NPDC002506]|uniref:hypothetical protein n=1 Tax=Streptomyces sp. NPDC002506 TaxID=3154536 RepID=UPI00331B214C